MAGADLRPNSLPYCLKLLAGSTCLQLVITALRPAILAAFAVGCFSSVLLLLCIVEDYLGHLESESYREMRKMAKQKLTRKTGNNEPKAEHQGHIQITPHTVYEPGPSWGWGYLVHERLICKAEKGVLNRVINVRGCEVRLVKPRPGRLWRSINYIRLLHKERHLYDSEKQCHLFFRNGKEMEEWYLVLNAASNSSKNYQSASRAYSCFYHILNTTGIDVTPQATEEDEHRNKPSQMKKKNDLNDAQKTKTENKLLKKRESADWPKSVSTTMPPMSPLRAHHFDHRFQLSEMRQREREYPHLWFNLFMHRMFLVFCRDRGFVEVLKKKIQKKLLKTDFPSVFKDVRVGVLHLGSYLPIFKNIEINSIGPDGTLRLDADIEYHGHARIEFRFVLCFNIIKSFSIPVSVMFSIKRVIGRIQVAFSPVPSDVIWIGFYREPLIDISLDSALGERYKVGTVTNILIAKLKQELIAMLVLPEMDDWPLPKFGPVNSVLRRDYAQWEYQPETARSYKSSYLGDDDSDNEGCLNSEVMEGRS
ncbi:uncharacterized protein LOC126328050 [Schistocerca gregaria]|uniref:uncharacterized protein LOC126328050 n=1 Tax=Schistocerca gregaria TaxID=7010 RepID=UPI00211DB827|nr:uncharacterized protein LOC126328050 [Schistocerca gregaria]